MKVVLIGAGNVATHLGWRLKQIGAEILQVYSRTEESAQTLSKLLDIPYCYTISKINRKADFYIYAVKDSALPELISQINRPEALHIHTAGSVPMDIFKLFAENYGVLYPLQTFSKDKPIDFKKIPLFIEGNNEHTINTLKELAAKLSEKQYFVDSEKRKRIHLSAVFACNFSNYMYSLANEIIAETDTPFEALLPLIEETADKVKYLSPKDAQTGPAVRNDEATMQSHINLLNNNPKALKTYLTVSEQIKETHQQ